MKDFIIVAFYLYNIISILILFMFLTGRISCKIVKFNRDTKEEYDVDIRIKYIFIIVFSYCWPILPFVCILSELGRKHSDDN